VSIIGIVFGDQAARGFVATQLTGTVGPDAARMAQNVVARSRLDVAGLLPTIMGVVALLIGATTVFTQMQTSLNRIWGVVAQPRRSAVILLLKTRLLALTVVLATGVILLATLVGQIALRWLIMYAENWVPVTPVLLHVVETAISAAAFTVLFALIFKILPDVEIAWSDVWTGAATTALLFVVGQSLIAAYLVVTATGSTYGAAGSLVLLLFWVYYSALMLYFGAALTKAHALASGRPIVPRPTAVLVKEEMVAREVTATATKDQEGTARVTREAP